MGCESPGVGILGGEQREDASEAGGWLLQSLGVGLWFADPDLSDPPGSFFLGLPRSGSVCVP